METVQSTPAHAFDPEDLDYLVQRAVDPDLAWKEGLRSMTEAEVHHWTGNVLVQGGGLCQPYQPPLPPPWANANKGYVRIQLRERDQNGGRKTDVPSGPVPLYFTSAAAVPSMDPIYVSESPIKALAIASAGYPHSVGLGGVDAGFFVTGTQGTKMQPHLVPYFPKGRTVYIVMDAGRADNPRVAIAEAKIARKLLDLGCTVKLVELPMTPGGSDQGPDDFIAANGKQAFAALVSSARNADPVQHATDVKNVPGKARELLADLPFCASLQLGGDLSRRMVAKALKDFVDKKAVDNAYRNHPAHRAMAVKNGMQAGNNGQTWEKDLITDKSGIKAVTANYTVILENDPAWRGTIAYDELANEVVFKSTVNLAQFLKRKPGDKWTDADDVSLANWLQQEHGIAGAKVNAMRDVVALVARRRAFCPLRERLEALTWDGVCRVDNWLTTYCKVAPSEYSRLVGRLWLISAIARAFEPGCKVDHVLVLEGAQGLGKSTVFKILAFDGAFFNDDLRNVGDAEAAKQLQAKWICELSELAAITRRDLETVKSFITRQVDNFRPSYGRSALDFPRRVVFGGSVNPVEGQGYLKDVSGERRWWPVRVGEIALADLKTDRDQLLAEAVALYKAGARWHPTSDEARRLLAPEQSKRRDVDAFEEPLKTWLSKAVKDGGHVSMETVLSHGLDITLERHGSYVNRVRKVMHTLGWVSKNVRERGDQFKAWFRGDDAAPHDDTPDTPLDMGDVYSRMIN